MTLDEAGTGRSRSEEVVSLLQERIVAGEIPVGARLRHSALAEELGVSRTPVREALHVLAAQGYVAIEKNRGAQVLGRSAAEIREIGAICAELEAFAAELASRQVDDEQASRMATWWERARDLLDDSVREPALEWVRASDEFHTTIRDTAGNQHLSMMIEDLRRRVPHRLSFGAYAGDRRLIARNLEERRAVFDAILRADSLAARTLMASHVRASMEATARWTEETLRADD